MCGRCSSRRSGRTALCRIAFFRASAQTAKTGSGSAEVLEESLTLREYDLKVNNVSLEREIPEDLPR